MTKRMERPRVLYSAKTKTTKVVPTSSTRRPLSLPTSLQTDERPAPLASIESDVSLITRRDREFHKSAHISGQIHRPISLADHREGKASNKDITIWKRNDSSTALVRSTLPRSTIRVRHSRTSDLPKSHSLYQGDQKSNRPRSEDVTGPIPHRGITSDSGLCVSNDYAHQRLQNDSNHKVRPVSSSTLDRNKERSRKHIECGSALKGNIRCNPAQRDVQSAAPLVAPKPKIDSKVPVTNIVTTHNKLPSTRVLESSPIVIRKEGRVSSKENHLVSAQSLSDSDHRSKPRSRKAQNHHQLEREFPLSNNNTASASTNHSEMPHAVSKHLPKESLLESISPLKSPHNENGEPPELYMSATRTHDHTAMTRFSGQQKDHTFHSRCNSRKPLANISITSNTPTSSIENIHGHSDLNTTHADYRNNRHQKGQSVLNNTMSPVDKDPANITHAEHMSPGEIDHFVDGDFKPSWKRNSMRLATQGYTSMSDLTRSVECVCVVEQEVSKPARSVECVCVVEEEVCKPARSVECVCVVEEEVSKPARPTGVNLYTEKHDGNHVETPPKQLTFGKTTTIHKHYSERYTDNKICNGASVSIEEIQKSNENCQMVNSSICHENPLGELTRNGINRLSYRMATSGVANAWAHESDGCGYMLGNNLSPVTERLDAEMRSDHGNIGVELSRGDESNSGVPGVALNIQTFSNAASDSDKEHSLFNQTPEANRTVQNIPQSNAVEPNEHLNKIKRLSYLLATTASISDLTFLEAGLDFTDSSGSYNNTISERVVSNSGTIHTQRGKHVEEFQQIQTRDITYNNSTRPPASKQNSEINNGRYTSAHRMANPESTSGSNLSRQTNDTPSRHRLSVQLDSSDVDSNDSGNTSCYYSASPDTSFVTADGDPSNSEHWSHGQASPHQRQRSAGHIHGDMLSLRPVSETHDPHRLVSFHRLADSHRMTPTDQIKSSPVRSAEDRRPSSLHSHDDRSYNRLLLGHHPTDKKETLQPMSTNNKEHQQLSRHNTNYNNFSRQENSQNTQTPKNSSPVNVFQCYGCGLNDRQATTTHPQANVNTRGTLNVSRNRDINPLTYKRHPEDLRKISSERNRFLYPANLPGNFPIRIRKCPAGADIFQKDESSTTGFPGTPTFGSIASFENDIRWETTPRFPPSLGRPRRKLYAGFDSQPLPMDSYTSDSSSVFSIQSCGSWGASRSAEVESSSKFRDVAPSIRSVSSIAYGSTRSLSDNDETGFLTDSKHLDYYNFYPHFNNSVIEHCLQDSFHGKNFSRESLESCVSDATTIEENSDFAKLDADYSLSNGTQRKNSAIVESGQRNNDQFDRLNNGSVLGSVDSKLHDRNFDDNKRQQEKPKASSRATSSIQRSMRKGRYLSSKEFLDFILTPDKTSKKDSGTLEKQAQKMYEVILCCNEVDFQPAREYNF